MVRNYRIGMLRSAENGCQHRMVETLRMPYLYRLFPAKKPLTIGLFYGK